MKVYGIYKEVFPDSGALFHVLYKSRRDASKQVDKEMKHIGGLWQKANKDTWAGGNTIIEIQEFTVV